jgi:hypothetical protein
MENKDVPGRADGGGGQRRAGLRAIDKAGHRSPAAFPQVVN